LAAGADMVVSFNQFSVRLTGLDRSSNRCLTQLGNVNTAPDLMPLGQREVMVFNRV